MNVQSPVHDDLLPPESKKSADSETLHVAAFELWLIARTRFGVFLGASLGGLRHGRHAPEQYADRAKRPASAFRAADRSGLDPRSGGDPEVAAAGRPRGRQAEARSRSGIRANPEVHESARLSQSAALSSPQRDRSAFAGGTQGAVARQDDRPFRRRSVGLPGSAVDRAGDRV